MEGDFPGLADIEAVSRRRAAAPTLGSLPDERALDAAGLCAFLAKTTSVVLATTRPDGRPHATAVTAAFHDHRFWMPAVSGAVRLRNLTHRPQASLVAMEGRGSEHVMVMVEGEAVLHRPAQPLLDDFLAAWWAERVGGSLEWADTVIELRPAKVLSFAGPDARPYGAA